MVLVRGIHHILRPFPGRLTKSGGSKHRKKAARGGRIEDLGKVDEMHMIVTLSASASWSLWVCRIQGVGLSEGTHTQRERWKHRPAQALGEA